MVQVSQIIAAVFMILYGFFYVAVSLHGVWRERCVSTREFGFAVVGGSVLVMGVLTAMAPT